MILFDAVFINNGGGKVLLDILINRFHKENLDVTYLLDERVMDDYPFLDFSKTFYIKGSLYKRHLFYKKNHHLFKKIFIFGNIPPTFKLHGVNVITYFHNVLLVQTTHFRDVIKSPLLFLKRQVLLHLKNNTDYWVVQTNDVKKNLSTYLQIHQSKVLVYPFYFEFSREIKESKIDTSQIEFNINYLFVSEGYKYKGHKNLIDAFIKFNVKFPNSRLILTVSKIYEITLINEMNKEGYKRCVINYGSLPFEDLPKLYKEADFFVFPSWNESFGLGLIEAALYDLPVISANLPYVFEVIEPTLVFDSKSVDDIYATLLKSNKMHNFPAKLKVQNKLEELIKLIIGENDK